MGWVDFVLTTPIVYTGGGLEVTIDWDISNVVGSPTTNSFVWRNDLITGKVLSYISSVSGTTLNNARTARAQTKFTYTPCTSSSTNTQVSCDSYTWAENGQTYSTSGTYTATSINGSGCVHTSTLNLTIHNSTTNGSATIYSCTPYTWLENGNTYTASGVYIHNSTNANGCINTATLNLTITNNTTSSSNLTKCGYYIWPCNGETYTASGTYTCTSLSVSGCLNTETLNLTILPTTLTINENITDVSCNATNNGAISLSVSGGMPPYTYLWSTGATTSSISGLSIDDYQYTVTDNGGCSITNYGVVSKAEPITILDSLTYVTTSGGNNGAIFLTSSNGTAPYTYSINGGVSFQSSNSFTNLTANEYSVVVQDALGCSSSKVVLQIGRAHGLIL